MSGERIGAARLRTLETRLSPRDRLVLAALDQHRFLLTGQVQRLLFAEHATSSAGIRATVRALDRLRGLQVVTRLDRRIGGRDAGSRGFVWCLDEAGDRLVHAGEDDRPRRRRYEPSIAFLEHALAVAELRVRLEEAARAHSDFAVERVETEPMNWREYVGPHGSRTTLKPDLTVVSASGDFEDHWFIELDRGTESIRVVLAKCAQYEAYRRTGQEQARSGVFPLVVWAVPDARRAERIERAITGTRDLDPALYRVTTHDYAVPLLTGASPPIDGAMTPAQPQLTKGGTS